MFKDVDDCCLLYALLMLFIDYICTGTYVLVIDNRHIVVTCNYYWYFRI